jgi:hypothetical protein
LSKSEESIAYREKSNTIRPAEVWAMENFLPGFIADK